MGGPPVLRILTIAAFATILPGLAPAEIVEFGAAGDRETVDMELDRLRETLEAIRTESDDRVWHEETWDAVPKEISDPRTFPPMPGGQRAAPGLALKPIGGTTGFLVSAPDGEQQPPSFGLAQEFAPFSSSQIFVPIGGTRFDVRFAPEGNALAEASSHAFAIVFNDVDEAGVATLTYYDAYDNVLLEQTADAAPGGWSFIGAVFPQAKLHRVRVQAGTAPMLGNRKIGPGTDGVVIDNIVYGVPQPDEGPFLLALVLAVTIFGAVAAFRSA